jgi:hypothetical protein
MTIIKKQTTTKVGGCNESGTLIQCVWEYKLIQPLWKALWRYLKNLKVELWYDPVECKSRYKKDICTTMFIETLFTIAKLWEQPRCTTTINGLRKCDIYIYIYTYVIYVIYIYVYTYIYTQIYIYICIYIYIHKFTYTHKFIYLCFIQP